jgi:prepilin-type processing-associated H-X9-DG protein
MARLFKSAAGMGQLSSRYARLGLAHTGDLQNRRYTNATQAAHVRDGLSQTYLFGESRFMRNVVDPTYGKVPNWAGGLRLDVSWMHSSTMAAAVDPINQPISADQRGRPRVSSTAMGRTFGSLHPGGCSMCFADGSVRFMDELTALVIHQQLGTRADGLPRGAIE